MKNNIRYVQVNDIVYYPEVVRYEKNNSIYEVQSGYYLASYMKGKKIIHIVSYHQIDSCVVRHIEDKNLYKNYEEASIKAMQLQKQNKGENKC